MIATALVLVAGAGVALPPSGARSLSASGTANSSTASAVLASSMCGSAAGGYYQVAADGGVFAFGGARLYGSMAGQHPNAPIAGIIPTANDTYTFPTGVSKIQVQLWGGGGGGTYGGAGHAGGLVRVLFPVPGSCTVVVGPGGPGGTGGGSSTVGVGATAPTQRSAVEVGTA